MGEAQGLFRGLAFNAAVRVESRAERLTEVAGAVLLRETFERSGVLRFLSERLEDRRRRDAITHPLGELVMSRVELLARGRQDQDDADLLRADPELRLSVSERRGDAPLRNDATEDGGNPSVPQGLAPCVSVRAAPPIPPQSGSAGRAVNGAGRIRIGSGDGVLEDASVDTTAFGHLHEPGDGVWRWTVSGTRCPAFLVGRTGGMHGNSPAFGLMTVPVRGRVAWTVKQIA